MPAVDVVVPHWNDARAQLLKPFRLLMPATLPLDIPQADNDER